MIAVLKGEKWLLIKCWTIEKAEHWRADAFKLWCWRRLLRVPWTARTSNLSIVKGKSPKYSLEGLMLKLKLWYLGHSLKDSNTGKDWRQEEKGMTRGWDGWMTSPTQLIWVWASFGIGWSLVCCSPWGCNELDMTEWLNNKNNKCGRGLVPTDSTDKGHNP